MGFLCKFNNLREILDAQLFGTFWWGAWYEFHQRSTLADFRRLRHLVVQHNRAAPATTTPAIPTAVLARDGVVGRSGTHSIGFENVCN